MRIAAEFFFVRKNRKKSWIELGEVFDGGAHFRECFYAGESRSRLNPRIRRRHAKAIPFFLARVFGRKKKDFVRPIPGSTRRRSSIVLSPRKDNQPGAFLVVPRQIIKMLFLREDIVLRDFFSSGEAPQDNGRVNLGSQLGATFGVHAVRFTLAALLCFRWPRHDTQGQHQC